MLGRGRAVERRAATVAAALMLVLNGCALHRRAQPFVFPPRTPVELAQLPEPDEPPMIEVDDDDAEDLPPVPVAEGAATPKRQKKKVVKAPAPAPAADAPAVQAAAGPEPTAAESASVIGQLTPGSDQDPKAQQEAADLIAANEKRLNALPAETVRSQAALVGNVRNFQKQAQQALRTGDAGGARTLATKGKLLLDDLEKATGS